MDNPVRKLRKALGMSQEALARQIGMSTPSVRNYERNLQKVPTDVIEKLKDIAARRGLPDVAVTFSVETRAQADALTAMPLGGVPPPNASADFPERTAHWHQLLEYVLTGGVEVAIEAVTKNLVAFQLVTALARGNTRGTIECNAALPPDIAGRIAELRRLAEQPSDRAAVLRSKKRRTS